MKSLPLMGRFAAIAVLMLAFTGCTGTTDILRTPTPPPGSNVQSDDALVQAETDNAWDMTALPDDQRPDVAIVRYVNLAEVSGVIEACLNERGWDINAPLPDEQQNSYQLDYYVCRASYPTDPKYLRPLDEDQRGLLYTYYDTELRRCFDEHGQTMAELPSRGKFVEDYYRMTWDPYAEVTGADTPEGARQLAVLQDECSGIPPVESGVWG